MSDDEIMITLVAAGSGQSETIPFPMSSTLSQVMELAQALFGLGDEIHLFKDGKRLSPNSATLQALGIVHGDLLAVQVAAASQPRRRTAAAPAPTGGLDFSNLLGGAAAASSPAPRAPAGGGLDFGSLLSQAPRQKASKAPVYYPGMNLDDAMGYNPHPEAFITLLQSKEHLFKELNYHNPTLASKLRNKSHAEAVAMWREEMVKGGIAAALRKTTHFHTENEMSQRLAANPADAEAKEYFSKKERQLKINRQYEDMMEEYPEALGRVLMLYIEAKINGHPIAAFCDSGAQATIMSLKVAKECGLEDLIDTRFAGTAVGVGSGKILGRIHLVQLQIGDYFFPCSLTVMDDPKASGGTEMPFLLGLDMMKRHTCCIDLEKGVLKFRLEPGKYLETPFLHEKDLNAAQGGTKGFDANKANEEVEKLMAKKDDGDDMSTS